MRCSFLNTNGRITQASTKSQSKYHFSGHMGKIWEMVRDGEALVCYSPWSHKELDTTWQVSNTKSRHIDAPESNEIRRFINIYFLIIALLFSSFFLFSPFLLLLFIFTVASLSSIFCLQQIPYTRRTDILVQISLCLI